MKIQKFEITIAVPEGNSTVKIDDLIDTLRDRSDEFNADNCAFDGKEVEK